MTITLTIIIIWFSITAIWGITCKILERIAEIKRENNKPYDQDVSYKLSDEIDFYNTGLLYCLFWPIIILVLATKHLIINPIDRLLHRIVLGKLNKRPIEVTEAKVFIKNMACLDDKDIVVEMIKKIEEHAVKTYIDKHK